VAGDTELERLAAQFAAREDATHCASPAGAYANCLAMSARFTEWLRARGVAAGILHLTGMKAPLDAGAAGRWPACDPSTFQHWTTLVGDAAVDWTARQFDPAAPVPTVAPAAELTEGWNEAEVWACEHCDRLVDDDAHADMAPAGLDTEHAALARATAGTGPFPDPRHDTTAPLTRICAHR
jgi:hypothetical protein